MLTISSPTNHSPSDVTMHCDRDELARMMHVNSSHVSMQIVLTLSVLAVFIGTKTFFNRIRRDLAQLTVVIVGAGPIGLTAALIAVQVKRVRRIVLYEEITKFNLINRSYQIAIQPSHVPFLRSYGVDFDHMEGIWKDGCFYTRVGIYLEYIISILPLFHPNVELHFDTKVSIYILISICFLIAFRR